MPTALRGHGGDSHAHAKPGAWHPRGERRPQSMTALRAGADSARLPHRGCRPGEGDVIHENPADARRSTRAPADGEAVFSARGLTKVYGMGEVEVHALRGVD